MTNDTWQPIRQAGRQGTEATASEATAAGAGAWMSYEGVRNVLQHAIAQHLAGARDLVQRHAIPDPVRVTVNTSR